MNRIIKDIEEKEKSRCLTAAPENYLDSRLRRGAKDSLRTRAGVTLTGSYIKTPKKKGKGGKKGLGVKIRDGNIKETAWDVPVSDPSPSLVKEIKNTASKQISSSSRSKVYRNGTRGGAGGEKKEDQKPIYPKIRRETFQGVRKKPLPGQDRQTNRRKIGVSEPSGQSPLGQPAR